MVTNIYLMDERNVIGTETLVDGDYGSAFNNLMDKLLLLLPQYPCDKFDIHNDFWNIVKADIAKAKLHLPSCRDEATSWYTEHFSVVVHEQYTS